jgi:enoyl-CoA hydratase/carnithine racemase
VVEREELLAQSKRVALGAAEGSATAIEQGLSFVRQARGMDEPAAKKLAGEFRKSAHASADFKEGVLAFRRKRGPQWPSRAI